MTVFQNTVDQIASHLQPGTLVVLRSTVYPGTTEYVTAALADRGYDVEVAFCPRSRLHHRPGSGGGRRPGDDVVGAHPMRLRDPQRLSDDLNLPEGFFRIEDVILRARNGGPHSSGPARAADPK